jgi:dimethylsulfide dehydrogenase subunit gamma
MKKRTNLLSALLLSLPLLAQTTTAAPSGQPQPLAIGGSIQTLKTAKSLDSPTDAVWHEATEYQLDLSLAPPVHQSVSLRYDPAAPPQPVFVRAASDGTTLFLRLRWQDASKNTANTRTDFADAAAVQFALGDAATTSFMMGAPTGPVNIWYWQAGEEAAQNLAAGGFGSTTTLHAAGLASTSTFLDKGEWVVVFSRPLAQTGEHQANLEKGAASIGFALWQGEQRQRDGLKHVTMGWINLEPAS